MLVGAALAAPTVTWGMVLKVATVAWELLGVIRDVTPSLPFGSTDLHITAAHLIAILSDRNQRPYLDLFCRMCGWPQNLTEHDLLSNLETSLGSGVDVRTTLAELFNELEQLTTQYIRSGFQLAYSENMVLNGTFPYWCSLGSVDTVALLTHYHAKNYVVLMTEGDVHARQRDLLHRWVTSRSLAIKTVCQPDRLYDTMTTVQE